MEMSEDVTLLHLELMCRRWLTQNIRTAITFGVHALWISLTAPTW